MADDIRSDDVKDEKKIEQVSEASVEDKGERYNFYGVDWKNNKIKSLTEYNILLASKDAALVKCKKMYFDYIKKYCPSMIKCMVVEMKRTGERWTFGSLDW